MIFALWGRFLALPAGIRNLIGGALALGLAVLAFLAWDHFDDRAAIREHEAGIEAKLNAQASDAAVDASEAAKGTKARIDADTQRGIAAASGSADPLADAFKEW